MFTTDISKLLKPVSLKDGLMQLSDCKVQQAATVPVSAKLKAEACLELVVQLGLLLTCR